MVHPPEEDELAENPIRPMTDKEVFDYYTDSTFDFAISPANKAEDYDDPVYEILEQEEKLKNAVDELISCRQDCCDEWDEHTDLVNDFFRNPHILQNYYICKNKAFLKLCEIFDAFEFQKLMRADFRSFHLCEGPGYFIEATYNYWKRNYPQLQDWYWGANTLNPYFENKSCFEKLVDDSHIRDCLPNWFFGPSDDGDVEKLTEDYLISQNLAGTFDLVTADGSTNTQGMENRLDEITSKIICAEARAALILLRFGGRLILKIYRFHHPDVIKMMRTLADNFARIRVIKPMASRQGSCEKYLVCDGFGGKCNLELWQLVDCDEQYLTRQIARIRHHVETFLSSRYDYTAEDRRHFLRVQRQRVFSARSGEVRQALRRMFPIGHLEPRSPWMELYGHNLIRRYNPADLPNSIQNYINTANVYDPNECPILVESVVRAIMAQKKLYVTSDIPLRTTDSLFIEPIAFRAVQFHEQKVYFDFFESLSTIEDMDMNQDWYPHCSISERGLNMKFFPGANVGHVFSALTFCFDQNLDSMTFTELPDKTPPLYLSRLSASMFVLLYCLFDECTPTPRMIKFWKPKRHDSVRPLLHRLSNELKRLGPKQSSVRCFVPLEVFEMFHPHICYRNVLHLSNIYRTRDLHVL